MLHTVIDCERYPLADAQLRARSKATLERDGVLLLPGVLKASAVESIRDDALQCAELAYYTQQSHNIYLEPPDPAFSDSHARNRQVQSSKGCITTDQVPDRSALKLLYDAQAFRSFLCAVLDVSALFEYADPLSSINIHYAAAGQELGWHFDNSAFAITLLLQAPLAGGVFEYVQGVRDADAGETNYAGAQQVLDGAVSPAELQMSPGTLVLFRGRNAMHRVTPTQGSRQRLLAVLAYNERRGVALSESARQTFFGRLQ